MKLLAAWAWRSREHPGDRPVVRLHVELDSLEDRDAAASTFAELVAFYDGRGARAIGYGGLDRNQQPLCGELPAPSQRERFGLTVCGLSRGHQGEHGWKED